jgi:DNA-binding response OmpR family regulator
VVARVASVLRRARTVAPSGTLRFGDVEVDPAVREVRRAGTVVELTRREFDLLVHLASSPRQVFSRAQLLASVWDSSPEWQDPATVTVHVGHLRQKLEADPGRPRHLVTVRGVGYRLDP